MSKTVTSIQKTKCVHCSGTGFTSRKVYGYPIGEAPLRTQVTPWQCRKALKKGFIGYVKRNENFFSTNYARQRRLFSMHHGYGSPWHAFNALSHLESFGKKALILSSLLIAEKYGLSAEQVESRGI